MHDDLVSASLLSGSTAACMPAIWRRFGADHPLAATPVSGNNYSGITIGERRSQNRKEKTITNVKGPLEGTVQYQGSIWEILPVAHDKVPLSRGVFITAISFLQWGLPTVPPSILDQPDQAARAAAPEKSK